MKRTFINLLMLFALIAVSIPFTSCGKDSESIILLNKEEEKDTTPDEGKDNEEEDEGKDNPADEGLGAYISPYKKKLMKMKVVNRTQNTIDETITEFTYDENGRLKSAISDDEEMYVTWEDGKATVKTTYWGSSYYSQYLYELELSDGVISSFSSRSESSESISSRKYVLLYDAEKHLRVVREGDYGYGRTWLNGNLTAIEVPTSTPRQYTYSDKLCVRPTIEITAQPLWIYSPTQLIWAHPELFGSWNKNQVVSYVESSSSEIMEFSYTLDNDGYPKKIDHKYGGYTFYTYYLIWEGDENTDFEEEDEEITPPAPEEPKKVLESYVWTYDETFTYNGKYDSQGRLIEITCFNDGDEDRVDYLWSGNTVVNVQENITYTIADGRILTIRQNGTTSYENEFYTLSYDSEGRLQNVEGTDGGMYESYSVIWDGDKIYKFIANEGNYQEEFVFEYSGQEGYGFYGTFENPIFETFSEDGLLLAHPELFGLASKALPSKIQTGDGWTVLYTYNIDQTGYVTSIRTKYVGQPSGLDQAVSRLTWK